MSVSEVSGVLRWFGRRSNEVVKDGGREEEVARVCGVNLTEWHGLWVVKMWKMGGGGCSG